MSELTIARNEKHNFRWRLLTSVSAFGLLTLVYNPGEGRAADEDSDRPPVWIELGGQLERVDGGEARFAPSFTAGIAQLGFVSPVDAEHLARFSTGGTGKISFEPTGTDWIFSAAIRYGRSGSRKHLHTETAGLENKFVSYYGVLQTQHAKAVDFSDAAIANEETHSVLDFQAGKDVGLGLFGLVGHSTISAGVRFAQFVSQSRNGIHSDQNLKFIHPFVFPSYTIYGGSQYNTYKGSFQARRSFAGIGPSVTWDASATIAGGNSTGGITFDWGANAAILFGRQKAVVHQTSAMASKNAGLNPGGIAHVITATQQSGNSVRSRSVVVPNLGAFAGLSLRYAIAKVSLGYRADFFFGAMDGGLDTVEKENRGFYGPFATISVGIGG